MRRKSFASRWASMLGASMKLRSLVVSAAAAAMIAAAPQALAQGVERRVPSDALTMRQSFSPIVKRTAPATVNVISRRTVRQRQDPFWELFGNGVPRERVEQSLGSGAIVRSDGVIVTNHHVVEGMSEISVVLSDRRQFPAK